MKRRQFNKLGLTVGMGLISGISSLASTAYGPKDIPKTDTHMHLFNLEKLSYPWLKNAPKINKSFLVEDFIEASKSANVGKIVFMESGSASGSMEEVNWVISQAKKDPRIKGIVAKGVISQVGHIDPKTEYLVETGWVKGVRGGINKELLASPGFTRAMKELAEKNLSFDLLANPQLFEAIHAALIKCPNTNFVLDHLGGPNIKGDGFKFWAKGINKLAEIPNLYCKISGIITLAGKHWNVETLKPYVHHVIEQFGFERLVYGGDWPVVLRAGSYMSWARAFEELTQGFSEDELKKLYHQNADRIYGL